MVCSETSDKQQEGRNRYRHSLLDWRQRVYDGHIEKELAQVGKGGVAGRVVRAGFTQHLELFIQCQCKNTAIRPGKSISKIGETPSFMSANVSG